VKNWKVLEKFDGDEAKKDKKTKKAFEKRVKAD